MKIKGGGMSGVNKKYIKIMKILTSKPPGPDYLTAAILAL